MTVLQILEDRLLAVECRSTEIFNERKRLHEEADNATRAIKLLAFEAKELKQAIEAVNAKPRSSKAAKS